MGGPRSRRLQTHIGRNEVHYHLTLSWLPSWKSTFSQPFKQKCITELVRMGSLITFYLSKLWKTKFFILCDVIFLVRLQGKFEIDHSWEWLLQQYSHFFTCLFKWPLQEFPDTLSAEVSQCRVRLMNDPVLKNKTRHRGRYFVWTTPRKYTSSVRSPQIQVSGYCTKWQLQGKFP